MSEGWATTTLHNIESGLRLWVLWLLLPVISGKSHITIIRSMELRPSIVDACLLQGGGRTDPYYTCFMSAYIR